jgi:hypothetical protein
VIFVGEAMGQLGHAAAGSASFRPLDELPAVSASSCAIECNTRSTERCVAYIATTASMLLRSASLASGGPGTDESNAVD